jgi:hypothetical protein
VAGYFDELLQTREMLNSRYDDPKGGRAKPIDGQEFFEMLRRREERIAQEAFAAMTTGQGFALPSSCGAGHHRNLGIYRGR